MKRATDHSAEPPAASRAFTLTELLVVIAMVGILATVALASTHGANEQVLRSQCASNLRQIGVGLSIYATEQNGYLPICQFSDSAPWYTYEVARTSSGGGSPLYRGFMNLGLLSRTKTIADVRLLYCPAQQYAPFTYEYYTQDMETWPNAPSADDNVRVGYSYFPQLRAQESIGPGVVVPKLTLTTVQLEFGRLFGTAVTPMKLIEVNPQNSITTDLVSNLAYVPHLAYGELVGLNALFPDGHVAFQNARTDPDFFDPVLWQNIGSYGYHFRVAMSNWLP